MTIQTILSKLDKVTRTGKGSYKALCPCHAENTPSLTVKEMDNKVICHCFGCGATGVDVCESLGLDVQELFNDKGKPMNAKTTEELEREQNRQFLDEVRSLTKPMTPDSAPVKYLNMRGIKEPPPTIRMLPEYKQAGKFYQCLIARLDDRDGNRVSYKIIHLNPDGTKADVPIVKKTLPCERPMDGCAVRLYKADKQLAVAEGIETALAYYQDNGIPAWALDNAQNMKKFVPPARVEQLIIIADMDDSFTGQAAAYELARKCSNLIGKDGYALKNVNIVLIINNSIIIDSGQNIDYLNIIQ